MLPNGVFHFSEFLKAISRHPDLKRGCLIDTSILFAYAYPNDRFSESSVQLFEFLREIEVPVFTNVNIRSEFINKYFEVLVPEGLNNLYQLRGLKERNGCYDRLDAPVKKLVP